MDWEGVPEDREPWVGMVYEIENLVTGRKYIGQKLFWKPKYSVKTNKKTGKKVRKRLRTDSDWRDYWSSSDAVKADVAELGEDKFARRVVKLCKTKGELNYQELKEQVLRGVLESEDWYNGIIQVRIHKRHVKAGEDVDG
jgi:hypothetical protein